MTFHVVSLNANSTGTAKDLVDLLSSTLASFKLCHLAIYKSSFGSTEAATVSVWAGSTAASVGGSTITVYRIDGRSTSTANFTGLQNSSTPGSSGVGSRLLYQAGLTGETPFIWEPPNYGAGLDMRPVIGNASKALQERLQVRLGASPGAGVFGVNVTLLLEEIGKLGN